MGRKFLIVLDDVWSDNYEDWYAFLIVFKSGAYGSRVIVTTRHKSVALTVHTETIQPYHLMQLTDEDCWLLFAKHAFGNIDSQEYPELEQIGKKVVKKCNGLPLAAKTLGGLLRVKLDPKQWVKILESNIWNFSDSESIILPALRMSYHYLPSYLKPCFADFSIFPKNFKFKKKQLLLLWMAEDFLLSTKTENLEEVGSEYFDELVSRSFLQQLGGRNIRYVMHDLLHDLAKFYFYGTAAFGIKPFGSLETLRFKNMLQLKEWLPFTDVNGGKVAFPCLQRLFIQNCPQLTKGLPDGLFSLKVLVIDKCQQLVASVPSAPAIRELKLKYCHKVLLNELPPLVLKLRISGYDALESFHMDNNHCLQELDISDCPSLMLLPSSGISDTLKSLSVKNCGKLMFPMHQCYASLESLHIRCSCDSLVSFQLDLFPKLNQLDIHGCLNLQSLSVPNHGPLQHIASLRSLEISNCSNFVSFPEEGLPAPSLNWFRVDSCYNLKALPEQMHTLLPSLVTLSLQNCPELESFPEGGLPSSLKSLEICSCDKLIPGRVEWGLQGLSSLRSLYQG
ncbi:putative disease resistance RPP13-like protein 1 [Quercus lobata]|uniref:putative disease resistance RPP13-like protein 1 n=1 Tax=Quercus lobata TaxID=97700 RepID=UPI0012471CA3|nr:putative disease resistance RPP13-like protein 1 [Quercus lobata]